MRGGREMNGHYDNFWDLFQDVPALELPDGYSVLDEYRLVNDADPNYSKARLLHHRGRIKDFATFGLSRAQQWELIRLLLRRKDELDDITVEEYFSPGFLDTNFWTFWRTMFAFQNWHSVLEMKLYMHRFLDAIDGLNDMSALVFPKYNQYDSFVRPWPTCCASRACASSSTPGSMTWTWKSTTGGSPCARCTAAPPTANSAWKWRPGTWCWRSPAP